VPQPGGPLGVALLLLVQECALNMQSDMQVAECCTEALVQVSAADKVVEIIAETGAPDVPWEGLFGGLN
jgi:hypothetical protein